MLRRELKEEGVRAALAALQLERIAGLRGKHTDAQPVGIRDQAAGKLLPEAGAGGAQMQTCDHLHHDGRDAVAILDALIRHDAAAAERQ